MVIEIKKKYSKKKKDALLKQAATLQNKWVEKKVSLADFFGAELQKVDPLVYQRRIRNEWD
jgi:hypothetical protein